jgi:hypothetical protein
MSSSFENDCFGEDNSGAQYGPGNTTDDAWAYNG